MTCITYITFKTYTTYIAYITCITYITYITYITINYIHSCIHAYIHTDLPYITLHCITLHYIKHIYAPLLVYMIFVCMCVHTCTGIFACRCTYITVYILQYTYTNFCIHKKKSEYIYIHGHVCILVSLRVYKTMCVCICTNICIYTRLHVYIQISIYTNIQMHKYMYTVAYTHTFEK